MFAVKKGIGDVVGITLITLLTIVAIGFIWSYVSTVTSSLDSQLSPLPSCIGNRISATACYNIITSNLEVTMSVPQQINAITFVTTLNANSQTFSCGKPTNQCLPGTCVVPSAGQTKIYYIPSTATPESVNLYVNECSTTPTIIEHIQSCA